MRTATAGLGAVFLIPALVLGCGSGAGDGGGETAASREPLEYRRGMELVEDEPAALAAGIRRVLDDPARSRALGEAGRARVRERFGWDSIVDRLEAVYRSPDEGP